MSNKIRVIIADAQMLVRVGLEQILSNHKEFEVIGLADDETELMDCLAENKADVVIIDYNRPHKFSADTIKKIRELDKHIQILIISSDNCKENILRVLENGAIGFLTKECDADEIRSAIIASANKSKFLCHKVIDIIIENHMHKEEDCTPLNVSSRETEIIKLTAKGWNAKTIADHLFLSTHTVYTHKKNIMKKLKLKSTSELIVYAIQNNLVEESEIA